MQMNHQSFHTADDDAQQPTGTANGGGDDDDSGSSLLGGGYEWSCGDTYPPGAVSPWFARQDVQRALHLGKKASKQAKKTTSKGKKGGSLLASSQPIVSSV
jgi:hypothetical protein